MALTFAPGSSFCDYAGNARRSSSQRGDSPATYRRSEGLTAHHRCCSESRPGSETPRWCVALPVAPLSQGVVVGSGIHTIKSLCDSGQTSCFVPQGLRERRCLSRSTAVFGMKHSFFRWHSRRSLVAGNGSTGQRAARRLSLAGYHYNAGFSFADTVKPLIAYELPETKMDSRVRGNDGVGCALRPFPSFPVTLAKAGGKREARVLRWKLWRVR